LPSELGLVSDVDKEPLTGLALSFPQTSSPSIDLDGHSSDSLVYISNRSEGVALSLSGGSSLPGLRILESLKKAYELSVEFLLVPHVSDVVVSLTAL
jgi:hypothetical protein